MYDEFDRKILELLQTNADLSMAELGEKVGLSHTPCWRRVKRLQQDGVIGKKVYLLDPNKLGLEVNVYAYVCLKKHDEAALIEFEMAVQRVKDIVECYSTSGEKDYVLRVTVDSVSHYEKLLKRTLVHLPHVDNVSSTFALKQVKYTTELPL